MAYKSVVLEVREITLAIELIELGARLQLLEAETSLSRDRLIKLYKELKGVSPPKGMLPFSTDWFMTWQPNFHSSLFYNIYRFMAGHGGCETIQSIVKSYRLYLEHVTAARRRAGAQSDARVDAGALFRLRHAADDALLPLRRTFRRACARSAARLRLRTVPAAFARR